MSCATKAATILRESGHRLTPQRLMVIESLLHARGHRTAAEILQDVQSVYPTVDTSTVYRILAMLKERRLVTETDMGGGELSYEWVTDTPHHHLICTQCSAVQQLDHQTLRPLADQLQVKYGFAACLHHFAIFGLCRRCQAAAVLEAGAEESSLPLRPTTAME